jgi:hypothetical protein
MKYQKYNSRDNLLIELDNLMLMDMVTCIIMIINFNSNIISRFQNKSNSTKMSNLTIIINTKIYQIILMDKQ